ncbi:hypothetical protein [Chryseobacterium flavum]|uniref:hypothetical protein n=1 Tax=Chryseobacterium flavum TaxID=415851 RepID=UPI0028B1ABB4|nr:hypothetical protein [Chryseobacterium flavum]
MQILTCNNTDPLPLNLSFLGLDVLGVHLKKSNEWLYGIYRENNYLGFLYEGSNMSKEDQAKYARRLIPEKLDTLDYFKKEYSGKIGYYFSYAEAFTIVGFIEDKKVITIKKDNEVHPDSVN